MGLEETLLREEKQEGHAAQLRRTRLAYRSKDCDDRGIFEYGWALCRSQDDPRAVEDGVRILKALQFQNAEYSGYIYLAIAQAYLRQGDYARCRQHAHMLMQAYPKSDPERNANLRKAIELHKQVRNKTTEEGWRVAGFAWVAGLLAAGIGAYAMSKKRSRFMASG